MTTPSAAAPSLTLPCARGREQGEAAAIVTLARPRRRKSAPLAAAAGARRTRGKLRRQAAAAAGVAAIGLVLTALSLSHLAHGVALVTGAPAWQAWATAIGFDLTLIALESAQLCAAGESARRAIAGYARPSIIGVLGGSAGLNAFAFAAPAAGWWIAPAVALGVAIPALIYVLTRIAVALAIDCQR